MSTERESLSASQPYDFAQRLSDLCSAWDSQARPIAAEILGEIARIYQDRDEALRSREEMAVSMDATEATLRELQAELAEYKTGPAYQTVVEALHAAEAEVEVRKRLHEESIKDRWRLRDALTAYVEDDCRELADGEGLTTEEARLTYSPRYRWGRAALALSGVAPKPRSCPPGDDCNYPECSCEEMP